MIAALAILLTLHLDLTKAKIFIQQNRKQAIPISIGVYFLMGFTPLPASPLTMFLALMLGPLPAVLIASTGNTLAALVEYRIGASMANVVDFEAKKAVLPFGLGKLPITSPLLLMAGRLLPVGKRGFSILCGAYSVPIKRYLSTSIFMYIVDALIVAYIAVGMVRLF